MHLGTGAKELYMRAKWNVPTPLLRRLEKLFVEY